MIKGGYLRYNGNFPSLSKKEEDTSNISDIKSHHVLRHCTGFQRKVMVILGGLQVINKSWSKFPPVIINWFFKSLTGYQFGHIEEDACQLLPFVPFIIIFKRVDITLKKSIRRNLFRFNFGDSLFTLILSTRFRRMAFGVKKAVENINTVGYNSPAIFICWWKDFYS